MNTFTVTLPDGRIVTRHSRRAYTHVAAIQMGDEGRWFACFASSEQLAFRRAFYWGNCPGAKGLTVHTQIIPLTNSA